MLIDRTKLTATQVCYLLGITVVTLNNWYKYMQETPKEERPEDCPDLPQYIQATPGGQRYWNGTDVHKLYEFQKWLPKGRNGIMGKVSSRYWSKEYRDRYKNQNNK